MQTKGFQEFNVKLGRRLQALRKERDLSQEDVAEALNMDRVSIGYIEQGKRAPRLQTVYALAVLYKIPVKCIFDFE